MLYNGVSESCQSYVYFLILSHPVVIQSWLLSTDMQMLKISSFVLMFLDKIPELWFTRKKIFSSCSSQAHNNNIVCL